MHFVFLEVDFILKKMASINGGQGLLNAASSYAKFDNNKEGLSELISHEETKFFAVKPLYTLAFLQIILGSFILFAQVFIFKHLCSSQFYGKFYL